MGYGGIIQLRLAHRFQIPQTAAALAASIPLSTRLGSHSTSESLSIPTQGPAPALRRVLALRLDPRGYVALALKQGSHATPAADFRYSAQVTPMAQREGRQDTAGQRQ